MRALVAVLLLAGVVCASLTAFAQAAPEIAAHNRADQQTPPPRPPAGDLDERARKLWEAIVHDDPALAASVFFPRPAFLLVKDIADPGRYYDQLRARFERDIHALHESTKDLDQAVFERLELVTRGGYVAVHEEGNRLPYWASRHSWLRYRVGAKRRQIEVRVLITWDDRWYVIHLCEFH